MAWAGPAEDAPAADIRVDAGGRAVLPGFVDSHSHLVFAGDRAEEFSARMAGEPYTAGGIRATVAATRAASDEQLTAHVAHLVAEMRRQGTTTVEIKSGYGLTVHDEARSLAVARQFTEETTFLGAHVVPAETDAAAYVELVTGPMLAEAAPHARWIDAFCETGAFDEGQARTVLRAGMAAGLRPRLHANQLGPGPGVRLACELGLTAVDHCTHLTEEDVAALRESGTIATLLPGVEFSTRQPYPDARGLLDAGVRVALASDCNPGSCFTSSLPFCIALAVRELGMTPAEAVHAATATGARALERDDVGVARPGAPGRPDRARRAQPCPPGLPAGRTAGRPDLGRWPPGRALGCHDVGVTDTAVPTRQHRRAAGAVHAYTASGSVLALLMVHFAYQGRVETVLWLLLAAMWVDGTDGMLARRFRVKEVLPGFDGSLLDNIVDYMTYVLVPMALLWANGYLPGGVWGGVVASTPMLASCVQFCRTDAKPTVGGEHFFLGFPSYWNIVAFYVIAMGLGAGAVVAVLAVCTVGVFVPIRYIYPSRTEALWRLTFVLTGLWFLAYAAIVAALPDPPAWLIVGSLAYVGYYLALSLWLTLRRDTSTPRSAS